MKSTSFNHRIKQGLSRVFPKYLVVDGYRKGLSAITFDDGPCPGTTERVLDILDDKNIKATFFLSGKEAESNMGLVELIHLKGHQLANHGYLHKKIDEIGKSEYISGVIKTHTILEQAAGETIKKVFRPPFGELNINVGVALLKHGFQYAMWSYDSYDSFVSTDIEILDHLINEKPRRSEIFLMHDDYAHSASALPEFIKILKSDGHNFVRLDEI